MVSYILNQDWDSYKDYFVFTISINVVVKYQDNEDLLKIND